MNGSTINGKLGHINNDIDKDFDSLYGETNPNCLTEAEKSFDTIIMQKRDNGHISDIYRNDIDEVCKALEEHRKFKAKLDKNTLYRCFSYEAAKAIEKYFEEEI